MSLFVVETASAAGDSRNSLADHVRAANNFNGAPNRYGLGPFYELHVWAWKPNPHGTFADMNPNVSCDHAAMK